MVPWRYRLWLFGIPAGFVLMATCIVVTWPQDPFRAKLSRIRPGMTADEVIAIMGEPPNYWHEVVPFRPEKSEEMPSLSPPPQVHQEWPPSDKELVSRLEWYGDRYIIEVKLDPATQAVSNVEIRDREAMLPHWFIIFFQWLDRI